MINGQYFLAVTLAIAFIGLIIAYWKEGLGGGIVSFIVLFIGWSDFHMNFILVIGLISLPSVLYFTYWLTVHLALRKAEPDKKNLLLSKYRLSSEALVLSFYCCGMRLNFNDLIVLPVD